MGLEGICPTYIGAGSAPVSLDPCHGREEEGDCSDSNVPTCHTPATKSIRNPSVWRPNVVVPNIKETPVAVPMASTEHSPLQRRVVNTATSLKTPSVIASSTEGTKGSLDTPTTVPLSLTKYNMRVYNPIIGQRCRRNIIPTLATDFIPRSVILRGRAPMMQSRKALQVQSKLVGLVRLVETSPLINFLDF